MGDEGCIGPSRKLLRLRQYFVLCHLARFWKEIRTEKTQTSYREMHLLKANIWTLKADSHLPQRGVFSAVDCINAEIENVLSLCRNSTVHCRICTSVNEPLPRLTIKTKTGKINSNTFIQSLFIWSYLLLNYNTLFNLQFSWQMSRWNILVPQWTLINVWRPL